MWGLYPKRIVSFAKLALECLPVIALATGELAHFYAFGLQVLPQIVQMNEAHAASARTDLHEWIGLRHIVVVADSALDVFFTLLQLKILELLLVGENLPTIFDLRFSDQNFFSQSSDLERHAAKLDLIIQL